jgi:DnaJ-class molecular chaperone
MMKTCIKCRGKAEFIIKGKKVICPDCNGEGFIEVKEESEVEGVRS